MGIFTKNTKNEKTKELNEGFKNTFEEVENTSEKVPSLDHFEEKEKIVISDPSSGNDYEINGNVITTINGPLETSSAMRELCAITESGQIFVSRSHQYNPQVESLIARAKKQKLIPEESQTIIVDLPTIQVIYNNIENNSSQSEYTKTNETSMMRKVSELVARAAKLNASDIHFDTDYNHVKVQFRIDGLLTDFSGNQLQLQFGKDLMSTIFNNAEVSDASYQPLEHQEARLTRQSEKISLPANIQAIRCHWGPGINEGRFLVMRLLYTKKAVSESIHSLGYAPFHIKQIDQMRILPEGINFICGPTGSGKSTTLKTILDKIIEEDQNEIKVMTVEDPPEYIIQGARQVPITNANTPEERRNAFIKAIISSLRSDPNKLMIGEIRDRESAQAAFEGAMTGHGVWTSIHANNAMGILDRLRDFGVERFKLMDPNIVTGLISQRLIPTLCPHCKIPHTQENTEELHYSRVRNTLNKINKEDAKLFIRGKGCKHCRKGYNGRTVAAEIIIPDQNFMELMETDKKRDARNYWLYEQGSHNGTITAHALYKVLKGEISPIDAELLTGLINFEDFMIGFLKKLEQADE